MVKFDLQLIRIELKDLMHLFSCWSSRVAGNVISHKIKFYFHVRIHNYFLKLSIGTDKNFLADVHIRSLSGVTNL